MVRFHSPQSERSTFRRSGTLARDRSANRRLFRMILALGLVLIVMQRAGDPKVYRMFFPELQQTESVQDDLQNQNDSGLTDRDSSIDPTHPTRPEVDETPGDDNSPVDAETVKGETVDSQAKAENDTSSKSAQVDVEMLDAVGTGAIWTKEDQPAFYRLLSSGGRMQQLTQPAQQVGALSLLNQADVYLKSKVLIIGSLGRVEKVDAKPNSFGIEQYYQLWLNPNDASERPITCFCKRLLPSLEPYIGQELIHDGPKVHVEGVYLKRVAYASRSGSQLAPAIVGRITAGPGNASTLTGGLDPSRSKAVSTPMSWSGLVALAAGIAALVSILIFRLSSISARRIRAARQQSQRLEADALSSIPVPESLDDLANQIKGT